MIIHYNPDIDNRIERIGRFEGSLPTAKVDNLPDHNQEERPLHDWRYNESTGKVEERNDYKQQELDKKRENILRGTSHATISDIDTSRADKKYLEIEKTIEGKSYSVRAYADYSLLLAFRNNELEIGDKVTIEFVDNDLNKCYAQGKVVGF